MTSKTASNTRCMELGCNYEATTEVRWRNWSNLMRETPMCTAHAKDFVAKYNARVEYAVKINPTNKREVEHKRVWKGR